jgi:hypothetical protein
MRRDVSPNLRIDLQDPSFDQMRKMQGFRELEMEVSRQDERKKSELSSAAPSR